MTDETEVKTRLAFSTKPPDEHLRLSDEQLLELSHEFHDHAVAQHGLLGASLLTSQRRVDIFLS